MSNPEDLVFNVADAIRMEVQETQDEIMFLTINNFLERECNITVSKSELIQAIGLLRSYKDYGYDVSERWATAVQQTAMLDREYIRGVQDGIKKEHDRIKKFLKEVYE